jgi:hypothetical protein
VSLIKMGDARNMNLFVGFHCLLSSDDTITN